MSGFIDKTILQRDMSGRPDTGSCLFERQSGGVRNRLKILRAERDWSQAELAGRIDVSRQAINAIETGKHDPSLALAFRLARLFGQPIGEIFNDGNDDD
jgi:putative transcriptional regulator